MEHISGEHISGEQISGGADLYGANLREAYLMGANLYGADLYGADLYGADLYGADLYGAKYGDFTINKTPIQILGGKYPVLIFENHMQIGCKLYTHEMWKKFTDEEIEVMNSGGSGEWKVWKKYLLGICKIQKGN